MKPPLLVRELSAAERTALRRGLRSAGAFTLRRSQVLLARAGGQRPARSAAALGCARQTVRDAIRAWAARGADALAARGADALAARSRAPRTTHPVWPRTRDDDLKGLLHQSPRTFGKPTSLWTLGLVAEIPHGRGCAPRALSPEGVRRVLKRLGVGWKRAKHRLTSPDPECARKKRPGTG